MKELSQTITSKKEELHEKLLALFLGEKEYELIGDWEWDLKSEAVYCSDVIRTFPSNLEGTIGLIYPKDKELVVQRTSEISNNTISFLQFRIITTYGEIKLLTGKNLQLNEVDLNLAHYKRVEDPVEKVKPAITWSQNLSSERRAAQLTEKLNSSGNWWFDVATNEIHYSDGVYNIYGIPPQTLNAHLHTFFPFIHPNDRDAVTDAFNMAFREKVPLHLDFRIITPTGIEKTVRQITHWEYSMQGSMMFCAALQDITDSYHMEQKAETEANELAFINKLLHLNESSSQMGYWYINLLTRKIVYSDNIYRLYGLKPQAIPASLNVFLNFVHQEDREIVKEVTAKILQQHAPPDIQFRIVRQDGKVRYLSQKGKMVVYGEGEMVLIVTVQDITSEKNSERKIAELTEQLSLNKFAQHQAEDMAKMGSWVWELDTGVINWSDGIYSLLGLKPKSIELTQKMLLRYIHADDQHIFKDELKRTLQDEVDNNFECRVVRKGTIIHICTDFKILNYKGKKVFIGILQDITKEKELQIELSEKIQLAEAITGNMMDRAVITDLENTIRLWNHQCEKMYQIKEEDAIGKNFFEVLPQLKNEEDIGQINRCLKGETISLPASRGTIFNEYHDLHMIPIKNDDGKVIGILHLLHDVTIEQQMQKRLNERLSFIESLMEASVNRIIVMDRHMNYLYCNQKAADFYKLSKADIIGKNVLEVFPESINDPSYDQFRRALKGETIHIPALEGFLDEHYYEVYLIPIKDENGFVTAVLWTHYDLSGEIKMQRQLKKSAEILSSIDAAIVELDQEFRIRYINKKAAFFLNHSFDQLAGKILWEAVPRMVGSQSHKIILQVQKDKEKIEAEYFSKLLDRWMYLSASPLPDGMLLLFYDRQDIMEAKEKEKEEHHRLLEAQSIAHIGSYEADLSKMKFTFSEEYFRILGLKQNSVEPTFEFLNSVTHPDDIAGINEIMEKEIAGIGAYKFYRRIYRKGGELRHLHEQGKVIADKDGNPIKLIGIVRDVTELKTAQIEIEKNNHLLQSLFEVLPNGVCVFQAVRNEKKEIIDFEFLHLNKQTNITTKRTDLKGKKLFEAFPEAKPYLMEGLVNTVAKGKPFTTEYVFPFQHLDSSHRNTYVKFGDGVFVIDEEFAEPNHKKEK